MVLLLNYNNEDQFLKLPETLGIGKVLSKFDYSRRKWPVALTVPCNKIHNII